MLKKFHYGNFDQTGFHRGLNMTVEMDARKFEKDLTRFMTKSAIKGLRRGLGLAWMELLRDIVYEVPKIPVLTSALKGSMTVFVSNRLFGDSSKHQAGGEIYRERKSTEPKWNKGEEALLVVNAPYATVQHENFPTKSEPSAGMFYVLKKVKQYGRKYVRIVVDEVKKTKV